MSKQSQTPHEAASAITGFILRFSSRVTEQIGELLIPKEPFLKKVFSSHRRNKERLDILKLNCDIVIPHVAVTEYNLEHGNYWNRDNSDIVSLVRQLSFQAIAQAFERSGCAIIDANHFVKEKTERFVVYAATAVVENIAEEIMKDHELPSRISVTELVGFLGPARISTYKELWARDRKRMFQPHFIADLPQSVYQHWHGEESRDWDNLQFNIMLYASLTGLNLVADTLPSDIEVG